MTDVLDLLVHSRLDPLFLLAVLWLFYAITEAHR